MSVFECKTNRYIENQGDKIWSSNLPCVFKKHPDGQDSWSRLRHHLVDNFNNFHFYFERSDQESARLLSKRMKIALMYWKEYLSHNVSSREVRYGKKILEFVVTTHIWRWWNNCQITYIYIYIYFNTFKFLYNSLINDNINKMLQPV